MSAPMAALCEKELRYAMRNGQTLLSVIVPLMIVLFFAIVSGSASIHMPFLKLAARAGFFFPIAVAYSFVVFAPMLHNTLGFEGKGFQFLLMAPTRFENVLLVKNITHALLLFGDAGLVWLLVSLMLGVPPAGIVAMTLTGLLFLALVHFVAGNWLSIAFPRQLEFGHFRKRVSEMNALLGMVAQSASLGVVTAVYFQARDARPEWAAWVAAAAYLALSGVALLLYRASLKQSAQLALNRREILTAELCR